jgi:NDP-sugar pyrophosphorylase family protein
MSLTLPVAVLAGGLATRLKPITETIPKSLIEINGEPFLAHQLRLFREQGVERVVLCVGHLWEQIRDFAGDGSQFGLRISYSQDGDRLMGTGGAILRALPLLGDAFLVVYGDSYLPIDYPAVEKIFLTSEKSALMSIYLNEGCWDTSNVEFDSGRIVAYDKVHRTPSMRYIDYGLGGFRARAFDAFPHGEPFDLALVYQEALRNNDLAAFESHTRFYEIGSVAGIADLRQHLANHANP